MTIGLGGSAGTFGADAGFAFGLIWYLIHDNRCKHCIHAPAALSLVARGFGHFHGTGIGFITEGAAGGVDGVHTTQRLSA